MGPRPSLFHVLGPGVHASATSAKVRRRANVLARARHVLRAVRSGAVTPTGVRVIPILLQLRRGGRRRHGNTATSNNTTIHVGSAPGDDSFVVILRFIHHVRVRAGVHRPLPTQRRRRRRWESRPRRALHRRIVGSSSLRFLRILSSLISSRESVSNRRLTHRRSTGPVKVRLESDRQLQKNRV